MHEENIRKVAVKQEENTPMNIDSVYPGVNLEVINKWIKELDNEFISKIPSDNNLLENTKVIKKNILATLDTAHRLSQISNEQEIFDTTASMRSIEKEIDKIKKDVVSIAVFGQMSSGKSSFLNSLVGENLLTVAEERATATITIIRHIDNFDNQKDGDVEIHYKTIKEVLFNFKKALDVLNEFFDGQVTDEDYLPESIDDILLKKEEFLKTLDTKSHKDIDRKDRKFVKSNIDAIKLILNGLSDNRDNLDNVIRFSSLKHNDILTDGNLSVFINHVIFYKDIELLKNIELIDTPGLGSNSQLDTFKSQEFITKADIVMIITDAKEPMQKDSEVDILYILEDMQKSEKNQHFFDKVFLIVNKIDDTEKDRKHIENILNESLTDADIEIKNKNILFISSLYEYQKRFNKVKVDNTHFKNKDNIGANDLLNIEKTIYDFSAAEATSKFLNENIKKIDILFEEVNRNFENNLQKLTSNIKDAKAKIKKFESSRKEIEKRLSEQLVDIVADNYRTMHATTKSYVDDERVKISKEKYFEDRAKKENTFRSVDNNSDDNNYKHLAKKLMGKIIEETNSKIQNVLRDEVLTEAKINVLKDDLSKIIDETQKKYEDDYNVVISLDIIEIEPIIINLNKNIDLEIGIWKSIKQLFNLLIWGKEDKYIDMSAESWGQYSKENYFPTLKDEIKKSFKKVETNTKQVVKNIVSSILKTIKSQLEQELSDLQKYGTNKEEVLAKKKNVLEAFNTLHNDYIAKAKTQNINLFK